jgi:hypothetical protein
MQIGFTLISLFKILMNLCHRMMLGSVTGASLHRKDLDTGLSIFNVFSALRRGYLHTYQLVLRLLARYGW